MNEELTGYPSIDKPWLKYYSKEAINAPLPECTIYEYLWENNKDHLDDIAIIYFNRKITYGELFRNINKTASALVAVGVKKGEIVTVAMPSIPEVLYAVYALNKIGAVANMIHPLAGEQEICHYLNEVESKVFLMFTGTYEIVKDALSKTSVKTSVVVSPAQSLSPALKCIYKLKSKDAKIKYSAELMTWSVFIQKGKGVKVKKIDKNCYEMALISHTGGTTGEPKGVMCSDANVNALIYQLVCCIDYGRQGVGLVVLPPFVNYSLIDSMLAPLFNGYKIALLPKYEPKKFASYVKKYHPNIIMSIPAYWEALLNIPKIEMTDMSCLQHIYYGGETMSTDTEKKINDILRQAGVKNKLGKGLGSTEMMAAATQTNDDCNYHNCAGAPLVWVNCKTVEPETTDELTYGEQGEICFSGPTLMIGYYNNQEATDKIVKVHADGQRWLHTGDLGYITEDGVVYVTGQIKRIVMTKGADGNITKLFPDRIEKVLSKFPAISLCCVVGIKDDVRIHYPKAFVVLNDEYTASNKSSDEIQEFCKDKLPGYMIPDEIEYLPDLPRTSRGKIDYRTLEKQSKKTSR